MTHFAFPLNSCYPRQVSDILSRRCQHSPKHNHEESNSSCRTDAGPHLHEHEKRTCGDEESDGLYPPPDVRHWHAPPDEPVSNDAGSCAK